MFLLGVSIILLSMHSHVSLRSQYHSPFNAFSCFSWESVSFSFQCILMFLLGVSIILLSIHSHVSLRNQNHFPFNTFGKNQQIKSNKTRRNHQFDTRLRVEFKVFTQGFLES
uniref:Uncharacterized protein n=1 Tax=Cacopsylla melanoneura TaxID=428564 RepID=A0A8D9AX24_9HEMI